MPHASILAHHNPMLANPAPEDRPDAPAEFALMSSSDSGDRPQPRASVLAIDPYVPGKNAAVGARKIFKLSSNEAALGPSPQAIEAYKKAAHHLATYPDGSASALHEAISARFGLDPARIVCGAGSDELIFLLSYAYL